MEIQSSFSTIVNSTNNSEEINRAYQVLLSIVQHQEETIKDLENQRRQHEDLCIGENFEKFNGRQESRLLQLISKNSESSEASKSAEEIANLIREFVPGKLWKVDVENSTELETNFIPGQHWSGSEITEDSDHSLNVHEFVPGQQWKVRFTEKLNI